MRIELSTTIKSQLADVQKFENIVSALCEAFGLDRQTVFKIRLSTSELLVNIIEHNYRYDDSRNIDIEIKIEAGEVLVYVRDYGEAVDLQKILRYSKLPDPSTVRGRGLFLINSLMDYVEVKREKNGNVHILKKRIL